MSRTTTRISERVVQQDVRRSLPLPSGHRSNTLKRWRLVAVGAVVILSALVAVIMLTGRENRRNLNSVMVVEDLVSKHFILPPDEVPALITVTDASKLTTPFLKQAQDGDKILVYQNAKKVIIYRPNIDRVVDAGPVTIAPLDTGATP